MSAFAILQRQSRNVTIRHVSPARLFTFVSLECGRWVTLLSRERAIPQCGSQRPSTSRLPSRLAFRTPERFEGADERHLWNISREATTAIHEGRKVCARASRWRICFVDSGRNCLCFAARAVHYTAFGGLWLRRGSAVCSITNYAAQA